MIAVVIPAYNEEKVIGACLDSLATQQPPPDEIIVTDNDSSDHTLACVEAAQQRHPLIPIRVAHAPTRGISFAREAGWRMSSADWIIQLDADTVAPPGWLARIQASLNDKVDVIFGTYHFEGAPLHISIMRILYDGLYPALTRRFYGFPTMVGGMIVIRRSILEKIDGYLRRPTGMADDRYFAEAAYRAGAKIVYRPDIYLIHSLRRYRGGGMSAIVAWGVNDTQQDFR